MNGNLFIDSVKTICEGVDANLSDTLVNGYAASEGQAKPDVDTILPNPSVKVLNVTHTDLDGCVSAIVMKNTFGNTTVIQGNYTGTKEYDQCIEGIKANAPQCDIIVFTDFCPDAGMMKVVHETGKPFLILDHHKTAINMVDQTDPHGVFVFDTNKCGALLSHDYMSKFANLSHLDLLCKVTDDHDRWLRKMIPLSDELNTLFAEYGFDTFLDKFKDGMSDDAFTESDRKVIGDHNSRVMDYFDHTVKSDLPHNGILIHLVPDETGNTYQSDLNVLLQNKYDWIVFYTDPDEVGGQAKLSFRSSMPDIDLGATLQSMGRGGGGHPGAGGQSLPPEDVDEFIKQFVQKVFKNSV